MFFFKKSFNYLHVSRKMCKFAPKYNISPQEILLKFPTPMPQGKTSASRLYFRLVFP